MSSSPPELPAQYLIRTVSQRSGVKPDLVRAWEKRYNAVTPRRTAGGHRLYTEQDVIRLKLLNQATTQGHSISQVAQLPEQALRQLLLDESDTAVSIKLSEQNLDNTQKISPQRQSAAYYLEQCYQAVARFDARALEAHFEYAVVELGTSGFIEQLLEPLMVRIGESWSQGHLRPVHEHMATASIRTLSYILRNNYPCPSDAPGIVIATPAGQLHEIGALLSAISAEQKGWQVTYLGPNLPAEEIAAAVRFTRARAVAVSITVSSESHLVIKEIRRLKKLLGLQTPLVSGGRATLDLGSALKNTGALTVNNLEAFKSLLDQLLLDQTLQPDTPRN